MRRLLVLFLLACAITTTADAKLDDISWWKGEVDAAFAAAKKDGKPLFLYWGAVWCPPCNQIKKTIFTRREFQEKMNNFIPVYLDGDTESAQIWGEKLKARGYPTMMVMSPDGREVTRLPGGLQIEQFVSILDEALEQMSPMSEVLASARKATSGDAVPDAAYGLLAFYSWGQDTLVNLKGADKEAAFRDLAAKCPERLRAERSRLYALWLEAAVDLAGEEDSEFSLDDATRTRADARLREILGDTELSLANMDLVLYGAGTIIEGLHPDKSPARTKLIQAWETRASWVETNEALSVDERTTALLPLLELHRLERGKGSLPESFTERVAERAAWAEKASKDAYTRQSAMSTAGYLLRQVGLDDEAKALYTRQLEKAVSPHYFMSSLANLAKKDGDTEQAVGWMRKAYETSKGGATRFQWGTSYLMGLMDLVPDQVDTIGDESVRVFKELLQQDDAFAGRNNSRIKRLARTYVKWNDDGTRRARLGTIRDTMLPGCTRLSTEPSGDAGSMRDRCTDFFGELGKTPES